MSEHTTSEDCERKNIGLTRVQQEDRGADQGDAGGRGEEEDGGMKATHYRRYGEQ